MITWLSSTLPASEPVCHCESRDKPIDTQTSPAAGPSGSSPAAGPSGSSPAAGPSGSSPAAGTSGNSPAAGPSGSSPAAGPSNKRPPADIGSGLADKRALQFGPATQMGMGLDPRCNDNDKLELQHLAAATPAGTSQVAIKRHVAVTLATWDAVWGEYLHPKWAEQRMRLHGAQETVLERYFKKDVMPFVCILCAMQLEEEAAIVPQQWWGTRKQLVVFIGNAGIGTRAWSKRFEAPVRGLMWCPKLDQDTPGDIGRWVDRDCNAALNLQRIG
ncbi:hypothetical protein QJQ45_006753 [Haematococcus lacustris]|nr:hypothetical protein QJQ45_006753 [Haematococcus lacustris]